MISIKCLTGGHDSSPDNVTKRMKNYLNGERLRSSDQAWLVVDKDRWTDQQLNSAYTWAQERPNYGLAISNPHFEYWLLLHFEDGTGIASSQDCVNRLKRHLPDYNKAIESGKITRDQISDAIRRAEQRDYPPCPDWPRKLGVTTVYKLIKKILE